jgi:hypothetical protein
MNDIKIGDTFQDFNPQRSGHEIQFRVERIIGNPPTNTGEDGGAYDDDRLLANGYQVGDIIGVRIDGHGKGAFKRNSIRKSGGPSNTLF